MVSWEGVADAAEGVVWRGMWETSGAVASPPRGVPSVYARWLGGLVVRPDDVGYIVVCGGVIGGVVYYKCVCAVVLMAVNKNAERNKRISLSPSDVYIIV